MFRIDTFIVSAGLILATMSFITGLQSVKKDRASAAMMTGMHRLNGYLTSIIYILAAIFSLSGERGMRAGTVVIWGLGLALIIVKMLVVRNEKLYKYGSRLGLLLFVIWLIIIYKHIVA